MTRCNYLVSIDSIFFSSFFVDVSFARIEKITGF